MGGKTSIPKIIKITEETMKHNEEYNPQTYINNIRNILATMLYEYEKQQRQEG